METGHPSTRAVNSGSGNRALGRRTRHREVAVPLSVLWYTGQRAVMLCGWEVTVGQAESNGSLPSISYELS